MAACRGYIESLCWTHIADTTEQIVPYSGLCHADLKPKAAYEEVRRFRSPLPGVHPGTDKDPLPQIPPQ
jgi:hypothetical protein